MTLRLLERLAPVGVVADISPVSQTALKRNQNVMRMNVPLRLRAGAVAADCTQAVLVAMAVAARDAPASSWRRKKLGGVGMGRLRLGLRECSDEERARLEKSGAN